MAATLAGRLYTDFIAATNERFTEFLEKENVWPPAGADGVSSVADELWAVPARGKRRAVLIIDALRFDLAIDVAKQLGASAEVRPVSTTLPSTTPFGMTALLPLQPDDVDVVVDAGKLHITHKGHPKLEEREGRKNLIRSEVGQGKTSRVDFTELETVVSGAPVPETSQLVAFDYGLDDKGHSPDAAGLPLMAQQYTKRIARAVERLHREGFSRVDVVTDHGFIFAPPDLIDGLGRPSLPPVQAVSKQARYAVLAEGAKAQQLVRRALPFDDRVQLGFPRGLRTLMKAGPYAHGGISLQECVIPHLISRREAAVARLSAEVSVAVATVTGATIPFSVLPVRIDPEGQMSLETPQPLHLTISAYADAQEVTEPVSIEVRVDSPEQRSAVYLRDDVSLARGAQLRLRAQDMSTGETVADRTLELAVDWN